MSVIDIAASTASLCRAILSNLDRFATSTPIATATLELICKEFIALHEASNVQTRMVGDAQASVFRQRMGSMTSAAADLRRR